MFALEAEFLIKMGYPDEAVYLCLDGIASFPKYVAGYTMLAKAYVVLGRLDEAIQTLDDAVKKFPRHKTLINFAKNELGLEYEEFNLANFREIIERDGDFIFDYSTKAYRERLELNKLKSETSNNFNYNYYEEKLNHNGLSKDEAEDFYETEIETENEIENENEFDTENYLGRKNEKPKTKKITTKLKKSQEYAETINLNNLDNSDYQNYYQNYNSLYDYTNSANVDVVDGLANFIQNDNILDKFYSKNLNFDSLDIKELEYNTLFNKSILSFDTNEFIEKYDNIFQNIKDNKNDLKNGYEFTSDFEFEETIEKQEEIIEDLEDLNEYLENHKISEIEEFDLSEMSDETFEELNQINVTEIESENIEDLVDISIQKIQTETAENIDLETIFNFNSDNALDFSNEIDLLKEKNNENYENIEELNKQFGNNNFEIDIIDDNNSINSLEQLDNLLNDIEIHSEISNENGITNQKTTEPDSSNLENSLDFEKDLTNVKLDELENLITEGEFDNYNFELHFENIPKVDLDNLENIILNSNFNFESEVNSVSELETELENELENELETEFIEYDVEPTNVISLESISETILENTSENISATEDNPITNQSNSNTSISEEIVSEQIASEQIVSEESVSKNEPIDILQEVNSRLANAEYSWGEIERLLYENESKIKSESENQILAQSEKVESEINNIAITENKITAQENNTENSNNSEINTMPISETLAKIYESQEAYNDSIDIYRKLIIKNPAKTEEYNKHIKRLKKILKKLEKK